MLAPPIPFGARGVPQYGRYQHDHSVAFAALRSATVKYSNSGDASFDSSVKASLETKALSELNK